MASPHPGSGLGYAQLRISRSHQHRHPHPAPPQKKTVCWVCNGRPFKRLLDKVWLQGPQLRCHVPIAHGQACRDQKRGHVCKGGGHVCKGGGHVCKGGGHVCKGVRSRVQRGSKRAPHTPREHPRVGLTPHGESFQSVVCLTFVHGPARRHAPASAPAGAALPPAARPIGGRPLVSPAAPTPHAQHSPFLRCPKV